LPVGDIIDVKNISFDLAADSYNPNTDVITVSDGTAADTITIDVVGGIGSGNTFTFQSDGHGGTELYDPPAAHATIATGATLDLAAPSSESVTFAGGTGSLVLDDPGSFTGKISGFTGTAPDAAHSDTIDLAGINYNSAGFSETYNASTGQLSVTDGSHSASLTFDNFNGTLDFASDGNGGTLVTDPPANAAPPSTNPVVVASGDQFVFKAWGGAGSNVVADPAPGQTEPHHDLASLISSEQSAFTNWLASHDSLNDPNFDSAHPNWLKNVALGSQHASDFHSV
jgi:hypothetical protein